MIHYFYEYFLWVIVNVLDIGTVYYLVHNVASPRGKWLYTKSKRPPLTLKVVALGVIYGMVVGYLAYWFTGEILFRVLMIILIWIIIKWMTNEHWRHVILIYVIMLLPLSSLQAVPILLMQISDILPLYTALISQLFGLLICIMLYTKISLYKLFLFVKNKLKWIDFIVLILITTLMSVFYFFILTFQGWGMLIPAGISVLVVFGFYRFINYFEKLNSKAHHINSLLEGLDYLIKTVEDTQEMQEYYADTLKRIEFELPESHFKPEEHAANIDEFIENKKISRQAKMEVVKEIDFYWKNRMVAPSMMIYMLGTLLDNAFDTNTEKPLLVKIWVAAHAFEITVANASDRKSPMEINEMFKEGVSSKKGDHGYGLPNLSRIVKSYNGKLYVGCDYDEAYKSHYLTMTISIKQFNDDD